MKSKFIPRSAQTLDKKRQIGISFTKEPPEMIKQMIFGEEMWMTKRQFEKYRQLEADLEKVIDSKVDQAIKKGMTPEQVEDHVTSSLMEEAKLRVAS